MPRTPSRAQHSELVQSPAGRQVADADAIAILKLFLERIGIDASKCDKRRFGRTLGVCFRKIRIIFRMRDEPPAKTDVTEWIECSWTVYLNEPAVELPIELGVRSDLPQFTVTGLDYAFLGQAYMILRGKTELDVMREHQTAGVAVEGPMRRLAAATPVPNELSIHVHTCSDEFCKLLAGVDEQRTVDIARHWRARLWPSLYQVGTDPDPRQGLRESILRQLTNLAQKAMAGGRKLMVRIEFRRCTKDPATGRVHRNEGTRH